MKTSQQVYFDNRRLSRSSCSLEKFYYDCHLFQTQFGMYIDENLLTIHDLLRSL